MAKPVIPRTASSLSPGTLFGLQLAATFQVPFAPRFQKIVAMTHSPLRQRPVSLRGALLSLSVSVQSMRGMRDAARNFRGRAKRPDRRAGASRRAAASRVDKVRDEIVGRRGD